MRISPGAVLGRAVLALLALGLVLVLVVVLVRELLVAEPTTGHVDVVVPA